jgi:single-stranded-DNA-specific exonuclease
VIVTDHHLAPAFLPQATAIINPNVPGSTFPARNLAGVGVIFYTLLAVRSELAARGDAHAKAPLAQLLDLVAIGTVADVVPLDRVNRTLVEQGLRRIRAGHTRPGVLALLQVAGKTVSGLSTQDIGFGISPRLNAAGRLDDMSVGVRCLLATHADEVRSLAATLNDFNQKRRVIEQNMRLSADVQLRNAQLQGLHCSDTFSVCLMDDEWHEGVIGILAGRIKERLHRPCVVFTGTDDDNLKGSARSIKGVHIRDVLQAIEARHPGMIERFGGHAMAAGLTLPRAHFEDFRGAFEHTVRQAMGERLSAREYLVDGSLNDEQRTLECACLLSSLMPWGQGFEAPVFADLFIVLRHKVVGNGHLKLTLASDAGALPVDAIAFNCEVAPVTGDSVLAVYSLDINTWRDRQHLQLRVQHLEAAGLR